MAKTTFEKVFIGVSRMIGMECIYIERARTLHVRVVSIRLEGDYVEWVLQPIKEPGRGSSIDTPFTIGATFEYLAFRRKHISCAFIGIRLVTNGPCVRYILKLLSAKTERRVILREVGQILAGRSIYPRK